MTRRFIVFAIAFVLMAGAALAHPATTVFIVRHAERPMDQSDPPLDPAGRLRATELARVLADAHVDRIYVTKFKRTQQTAAPLAAATRITPVVFDTGKTYPAEVVERIEHEDRGRVILVVTHSDTIQAILGRLGVSSPPDVPATEFDDLFVVTLIDGHVSLARLRYGAPGR